MPEYNYRKGKYPTYTQATERSSYAEQYYRQKLFGSIFTWRGLLRLILTILIFVLTFGLALVIVILQRLWRWYSENNRIGTFNPVIPSSPDLSRLLPFIYLLPSFMQKILRSMAWVFVGLMLQAVTTYLIFFIRETLQVYMSAGISFNVIPNIHQLVFYPAYKTIIEVAPIFMFVGLLLAFLQLRFSFLSRRPVRLLAFLGSITLFILLKIRSESILYEFVAEISNWYMVFFVIWFDRWTLPLLQNYEVLPMKPQTYRIQVPQDAEYSAVFNQLFIEYLVLVFGECAIRIIGNNRRIFWEIVDIRGQIPPEIAIKALRVRIPAAQISHYPTAIPPASNTNAANGGVHHEQLAEVSSQQTVTLYSLGQFLNYFVPLRRADDLIPEENPIAELANTIAELPDQEYIAATLIIAGKSEYARDWGYKYITVPIGWLYPLFALFGRGTRSQSPALSEDEFELYSNKLQRDLYHCLFFITHVSPSPTSAMPEASETSQSSTIAEGSETSAIAEISETPPTSAMPEISETPQAAEIPETSETPQTHIPYYFNLAYIVLKQVSLGTENDFINFDRSSLFPEQPEESKPTGEQWSEEEKKINNTVFFYQQALQNYDNWSRDADKWREWRHSEMILDVGEMANFWRLPDSSFVAPVIDWLDETPPITAKMKTNSDRKNGNIFGIGRYQGSDVEVYVPDETRQRHMSILGQTGMGKSTLLHNLIHQDIENNDGRSVVVLDPHGDLVRDVLRWSIPENRRDDVVVLRLNQRSHPVPFNLFDMSRDEATISELADVIDAMDEGTAGHQTKRYMEASLRAIATLEHATMLDLRALLQNKNYGQHVVQICKQRGDFITAQFWQEYWTSANKSKRRSLADPIFNRISPFYLNDYLMTILCHPQGLPLEALLNSGKIILLSLDNSGIPVFRAQQNLIGAIFITLLKSVVMRRSSQHSNPIYCYVDEQQRFSTPSFAEIFSESRKRGLYMTVGNQFTSQLDEQTLAAIRGNVTTQIIFNIGADDASKFESVIGEPYTMQDLVSLDKYHMAIKTQLDGYTQPPFLARVEPRAHDLWRKPDNAQKDAEIAVADERAQAIIQHSIATYTEKTRQDVKDYLHTRYFKDDAEIPLGSVDTFDA